MKHIPWRESLYAVAFVVALLTLYVGSYYALVTPEPILTGGGPGLGSFALVEAIRPNYACGQGFGEVFFGPMHALDVRVRPAVWK